MKRGIGHIASLCLAMAMSMPALAQTETDAPAVPEAATELNWQICNETSFFLRVAHAVVEAEGTKVRGWREVMPGACLDTPYTNPSAPRFLFAESLPFHRGGIREWKGDITLCAKDEDFVSDATDNCALMNLGSRDYLAVKPDETRTSLIEASDFGAKAELAGTQRLLRDTGYKITKIDGLTGRRTSRSIRDFRKDKELDSTVNGAELLTALRKAAEEMIPSVGIELCNKSSANIWGAIATRDNGTWSSRGWWEVAPDTCTQIYTRPLPDTEAHFYALQEQTDPEDPENIMPDKRLRSVSATPAQFCIAESRFSALGREYCAEGGYVAANFRPLSTDKDGVTITLSDTDFAEVGAAGLRR